MPLSCLSAALLAAASLLAQTSHAQQVPVPPLTPTQVEARPVTEALGQPVPARAPLGATQPAPSQTRPVIPEPLYLVNSGIIVGNLSKIRPQDIVSIEVYKGEGPALGWRAAAPGGIINLTLKPGVKLRSVPLARLKRRQHLTGPVRYELDGRPLTDSSLRIATATIGALEIEKSAGGGPYKVLNIKKVPRQSQPSHYPPGTIFIRG